MRERRRFCFTSHPGTREGLGNCFETEGGRFKFANPTRLPLLKMALTTKLKESKRINTKAEKEREPRPVSCGGHFRNSHLRVLRPLTEKVARGGEVPAPRIVTGGGNLGP